MVDGGATSVCVGHRHVLVNLRRHSLAALERHNDRDIIDIERRWMSNWPYVNPVVQIVIKLNEGFVDLSTFLLEQLLLLLLVVVQLHLLVLRAVQENLFRELRDINVGYGLN